MTRFRIGIALIPLLAMIAGCTTTRDAGVRTDGKTFPLKFPTTNMFTGEKQPIEVDGVTTYFGGQLHVFVMPGDRPRILHLSSQYPAIWRVFLFPGAQVKKIYVSAFRSQKVEIVFSKIGEKPPVPEIIDLGNFESTELSLAAPTIFESQKPTTLKWIEDYKKEVEQLVGAKLTSAQGLKTFRVGDAISIPANSPLSDSEIARHFDPAQIWERGGPSAASDLAATRRDLRLLIKRGDIPAQLMPYENPTPVSGPWEVIPPDGLNADDPQNQLEIYPSRCSELQLGSPFPDLFKCYGGAPDGGAATKWIFGGGGGDIIDDIHARSQLINGGAGDDIMGVDLGSEVFYFGKNWGHDTVEIRCLFPTDDYKGGTAFPEGDAYRPAGGNLHYLIFGKGIYPKDLEWKSDTLLVNRRTGDSIQFYEGICAKMVAVEKGALPPSPAWEPDE